MAGEAILVVDDNPTNMKLVTFLLEKRGYVLRTAANAFEALALLATFPARLILMDLEMPGMDGLELTRRLKADPATRAVIIVALTAYAMKGDEEKAREAGCDGYLTKPVDTRALPDAVAAFLESSARSRVRC
jgi:two-component system, cell cycle response regulator DivK